MARKKLTATAIRALRTGEKVQEGGVIAERLRNGDVRWSVNAMTDGRRVHRVVGLASENVTLTQAEAFLAKIRTDARADRLDLPTGRKLHRTFAQSATDYLTRMDETDGRDMANKHRHLTTYLVPFLGSERLDKITEFRLRQYRKHRAGRGAKPATINRELATFSHLMRKAASKSWGWIKPEAIPEVPKEAETRKQIRILTPEQCTRLIASAESDDDRDAYLFVMFGLNAGMRHSEIMARRFDEVDFAHRRIWIDKAKAGERQQPITAALCDALARERERREDKAGWIFPARRSDTKTGHRRDMVEPFARCVKRAGLDPKQCTPHVMRHTAITRMVQAGHHVLTIKSVSGHKTTRMVEHYTHLHGAHIDDAVAALDTNIPAAIARELHTAPNEAVGEVVGIAPNNPAASAA